MGYGWREHGKSQLAMKLYKAHSQNLATLKYEYVRLVGGTEALASARMFHMNVSITRYPSRLRDPFPISVQMKRRWLNWGQ